MNFAGWHWASFHIDLQGIEDKVFDTSSPLVIDGLSTLLGVRFAFLHRPESHYQVRKEGNRLIEGKAVTPHTGSRFGISFNRFSHSVGSF
jgi:hypothetical protein